LVAPFITNEPLNHLASILNRRDSPTIELLTNLAVDHLLQETTDAKAIASFCREQTNTMVRHLPGLHAKAYVADHDLAIITSGNLTYASLNRNYEYGIQITDRNLVRRISQDLRHYGSLGSQVSLAELDQLGEIAAALRTVHAETFRTSRAAVRLEFQRQLEAARESLRHLRARPGESTNTIFSRTILYVLRKGPLSTEEIHPLVEGVHPDLCDNSIDRVINGTRFGRRWKHMVRNAQQSLKAQGLVEYAEGKWRLTRAD
jgi:hypothetical protein